MGVFEYSATELGVTEICCYTSIQLVMKKFLDIFDNFKLFMMF